MHCFIYIYDKKQVSHFRKDSLFVFMYEIINSNFNWLILDHSAHDSLLYNIQGHLQAIEHEIDSS